MQHHRLTFFLVCRTTLLVPHFAGSPPTSHPTQPSYTMAPRKGTTSKSPANKSRATRGKAAADKKEAEDKNEVTATPTKKRKTGIATWLGKSDDSSESDEETSTAKVRDGSKQPAKSTTKSQRRLSGYLRTSKSTTNPKTGEKEEVEEERVTTAVSETTATPGQTITRTLQKEVVDTVTVSTKAANSGKKRKLEEDGDFEYTPAASTAKAIALAGAEEEGEEPWFLQRPRRKARDSAQVILYLQDSVRIANVSSPTPNSSKTFLPATSKKRSRTLTSEKMPLSSQTQSTLTTPTTRPAAF